MADQFPEPLIIPPRSLPHKQTFILLHGRGSSGQTFGPPLLKAEVSPSQQHTTFPPRWLSNDPRSPTTSVRTLATIFPHARFVFPSAARRRATIYRRSITQQWFDNWRLDPPATKCEGLQVPGLAETTRYLHGLLEAEIAAVPGGAKNVVLGGLSQGCAASLIALLLWEGEPLGAAFGMCGWLPFAFRLSEQIGGGSDQMEVEQDFNPISQDEDEMEGEQEFDPFLRDEDEIGSEGHNVSDPGECAVAWLREELQITSTCSKPLQPSARRGTPLFLGHGVDDHRVSIVLGRDSYKCLKGWGLAAGWNEYESLGHWYSPDMLRDIADFIITKMG